MSSARYLVGIDLGTTNSVVASIDLAARPGPPAPRVLPVPQVSIPGEVRAEEALPSFLYLPSDAERASGRFGPPWDPHPDLVAGVFARDEGAQQPARQVSSAKSWLSHPTADRTARILPWGSDAPSVSPVEASARILRYLREAWNHEVGAEDAAARLEHQHVVLTVPASFDQEARELTLQAAHAAGLPELTLIEEPLAAFYAWIAAHRGELQRRFRGGEEVLICDVGGGTTDFTTIRVHVGDGEVAFERTAVGEHLLLGGDNLDLALAHQVEASLGDRTLSLVQRLALRRAVTAVKEALLSDPTPDRLPITVLGSGRAVVGAAITTELTRDAVVAALADGFLPYAALHDRPRMERRAGLLEMGLPYAADPAITRHLAAFLEAAALASSDTAPRRPDAVLFNGGFFTPLLARERVVDVLARWFAADGSWRPVVLENPRPASAVAMGAAHYALVRERGGLRVRAGSARAYYVGLRRGTESDTVAALCVLPRGSEEGTSFDVASEGLAVTANRPVSFPLVSSATRRDRPGDVVQLAEPDVHRHAPLATVLRYGRKSRHVELQVSLSARYTETGTLEVSCASLHSEHRWRLRFQLRGEREWDAPASDEPDTESVVGTDNLDAARAIVGMVFGPAGEATAGAGAGPEGVTPETLPAKLEAVLGYGRLAWGTALARSLADTLLELADGRRHGPRFEARWLNLLGFCLRPGFGAPADDWRIGRVRGVYVEGLLFPNDQQCQVEWAVLWQRVAGGLKAGQQRELYLRYAALLGLRGDKRVKRVNPQVQREAWRLMASLEHLPNRDRATLGESLLDRLDRDRDNTSFLWAIGRLGARVPAYGPLTAVVPADRAAAWVERLLDTRAITPERAAAIVQVGARTDDPLRDLPAALRERAAARLGEAGFAGDAEPLHTAQPTSSRTALQVFGETLPPGLRLLS